MLNFNETPPVVMLLVLCGRAMIEAVRTSGRLRVHHTSHRQSEK